MFAFYFLVQNLMDRRIKDRESGASAVEYGLLIGLIAVAIIGVLIVLGPRLADLFSNVNDELPATPPAP